MMNENGFKQTVPSLALDATEEISLWNCGDSILIIVGTCKGIIECAQESAEKYYPNTEHIVTALNAVVEGLENVCELTEYMNNEIRTLEREERRI